MSLKREPQISLKTTMIASDPIGPERETLISAQFAQQT